MGVGLVCTGTPSIANAKDGVFVFDLDQNYRFCRANAHCWFQVPPQHDIMEVSNRSALETVASEYARRLVRYRALAHGAPGANYFSRNSTSLGVFRFVDEVAQRLNIAELVSEKLLQFARIQNGDFPTTDNN